ncbi:MAG: rhomboid protein [Candidatus Methanoperedens nitroreducens]|uniref:Rhomboid protein n=2 Tax=Candidatus Methanoperedens TaxID=1392997 RepID=A0A0P8A5S2_9EURY|nr:MAG: rhomboid family intramembrane serine protease [Candidatus Methanoperedens sp.]KPQ41921.1 MAG: rhomboid protein [Candidatus Methanoperedens sp. BLZ1]MBZ0174201.1 rhomboid family intramembrane serine protease [Candidatus Methanoperedens nitroreducens]CAG1000126.1 Rhomboid protease GluP [Methanosarcinales archaeon]
MTKECYYCGFRDPMPFTCKFCGNSYCYNHRLPESHNCPGLLEYKSRARDTGIFYKKDSVVRRKQNHFLNSLNNIISAVKSNYSLMILLIVLISFVLQYIIPGYFSYLALSPYYIFSRPWTLITHMFLHSGPVHLLFNMMFLFFFGPELERRIGGKRFLFVFFISGIIAAIGYSLWSVFILKQYSTAVGASGALFGIFACLAILAPDIEVGLFFFIRMKITYALIFFALLDLLFIGSSGDLVARSAHLSGVVAGLAFGKYLKKKGNYLR